MIKGSKEKSFCKELQETRDSRNCVDCTISIKIRVWYVWKEWVKKGGTGLAGLDACHLTIIPETVFSVLGTDE